MNLYLPYLGIVAALLLAGFVFSIIPPRSVRVTDVPPAATDIASATPRAAVPLSESAPAAATRGASPKAQVPLAEVAKRLQGALVNILCAAPPKSGITSISGSGVIIDAKGVILTNAHIGQYFLLGEEGVKCAIRAGSPATARYEAELLYISPLWVVANPAVLTNPRPVGTGEYDYALLAITESLAGGLPSPFPAIALGTGAPAKGASVVVAGYGAQDLETSAVTKSLFPTVVFASVRKVFTFATQSIDVLDVGGSEAAQEGSSGGGVADGSGTLIATLTTSSDEGAYSTRSLGAITAPYIRRVYEEETGGSLTALLAQGPREAADAFAYRIPALASIITAQLR